MSAEPAKILAVVEKPTNKQKNTLIANPMLSMSATQHNSYPRLCDTSACRIYKINDVGVYCLMDCCHFFLFLTLFHFASPFVISACWSCRMKQCLCGPPNWRTWPLCASKLSKDQTMVSGFLWLNCWALSWPLP